MKKLITLLLLTVCITVSAQYPHFSREKPHKPTPKPPASKILGGYDWVYAKQTTEAAYALFKQPAKGLRYFDGYYWREIKYDTVSLCSEYQAQINAMQTVQDSLLTELVRMYEFYELAKPVIENLIIKNRMGTMRVGFVNQWDLMVAIKRYRNRYVHLEKDETTLQK